jgi:tRNA nucleotidyltransferase/poly(A) polymerase
MTQNPYFVKILQLSQKKKQAVYLVGGFLRDQYLNRSGCLPVRQAGDFDFAVSKDAIVLAKSFARSIKGAFVLLDEDHPCARVVIMGKYGLLISLIFVRQLLKKIWPCVTSPLIPWL